MTLTRRIRRVAQCMNLTSVDAAAVIMSTFAFPCHAQTMSLVIPYHAPKPSSVASSFPPRETDSNLNNNFEWDECNKLTPTKDNTRLIDSNWGQYILKLVNPAAYYSNNVQVGSLSNDRQLGYLVILSETSPPGAFTSCDVNGIKNKLWRTSGFNYGFGEEITIH